MRLFLRHARLVKRLPLSSLSPMREHEKRNMGSTPLDEQTTLRLREGCLGCDDVVIYSRRISQSVAETSERRRVMSIKPLVQETPAQWGVTVSFGERFQSSEQFDAVFKQGMALVERTAAYLDGDGRIASKSLAGRTAVVYASESMRLTTRLLDLASWLLIRRALKAGEISEAEAKRRRQRVKLQGFGRPSHVQGFDDLPSGLRALVHESFALYDRIVQLDRAMAAKLGEASLAAKVDNPVAQQIAALRRAFCEPQKP